MMPSALTSENRFDSSPEIEENQIDMMNPSLLPEFSSLKKVHILGVGGTLMGAFAAFLKRRGIHVTGSDLQLYPP